MAVRSNQPTPLARILRRLTPNRTPWTEAYRQCVFSRTPASDAYTEYAGLPNLPPNSWHSVRIAVPQFCWIHSALFLGRSRRPVGGARGGRGVWSTAVQAARIP